VDKLSYVSLVEINRSQNVGPGLTSRGISCNLSAFGLPKQVFLFKREKKDCELKQCSYIKRYIGLLIQFTATICNFIGKHKDSHYFRFHQQKIRIEVSG